MTADNRRLSLMATDRLRPQVMLGIRLTDAEALTFAKLQSQILIAFSVPSSAMPVLRATLGVDKTLEEKAAWLTRYEAALHLRCTDCH